MIDEVQLNGNGEKFDPATASDIDLLNYAIVWVKRIQGECWMVVALKNLARFVLGMKPLRRSSPTDDGRELARIVSWLEGVRVHPRVVEAVGKAAMRMLDVKESNGKTFGHIPKSEY